MATKEIMVNLNQVSRSKVLSTDEMERKQRKRKMESLEETSAKKIEELECKPEGWPQPIGKLIKCTGNGVNKKRHYEKFEFRGQQYGLEDSVLLTPEDENQKFYVAIIKDVFTQSKEGEVKLIVQWFYRPEDVDKKYVKHWRSKDPRDLFYSFHRDEVFAESVKQSCLVYFVPEKKQIPNRGEYPDFIVKTVYNTDKKKLWKFTHNDFNEQQKHEIDFHLEKTISRVGDFPDIKKAKRTLKSRRKQSYPERLILEVEITDPESSNAPDYKSILEKFNMLTGDTNRDKNLEKLLEAIKNKCERKQEGCDYEFSWPDDVVPLVCELEKVLCDSFARDIPKYNYKLEALVYKLKNSRMLAKRFLNGELKAKDVLKVTRHNLMNDCTLDEFVAAMGEPMLKKIADPSTPKSDLQKFVLENLRR